MEDLQGRLTRWRDGPLARARARAPERRAAWETPSGIPLPDVATPLDSPGDPSLPGEFPFTRGIQPNMYRGRLWTMRQYAGFGNAVESNKRYRYLLAQGQSGLSIAFDLPSQIGLDSDDPRAEGEVGKVGVAIDTLADFEDLLDGIPLGEVTTSMTINAPAAVMFAMYVAVGEKQGVPRDRLGGTTQNDILKEYVARGTYIFPPGPSLRLATDLIEFAAREVPRWNPISISGYHIREAGSTAVQEVAFTLADGIAYVEATRARGLDVDAFAPRLSFFFNCHNHFLEEVAKFRAARRLWARIMRDRFGARDPRSQTCRFHVQTAGSSLAAQQIDVNVVRVTIQALAAVLGGCQSLHTNAKDEALCLPLEENARLALRTQQVIAHESGAADVPDPLGGAYLVEALTDEIERRAAETIDRIDRMGGVVRAIEDGYIQREIQESAYRYQKRVEAGEQVVVGVNAFRTDEPPPPVMRHDPAWEAEQRRRLSAVRARRDAARVEAALAALRRDAAGTTNLLPSVLEAVRAYASVGEICGVLRETFGTYQSPVGL